MSTQDEEEEIAYDKAIGQFRFALNKVLKPLRMYGQGAYVDAITTEIVSLALQLDLKLEGIDEAFGEGEPYHINDIHW